MFCGHAIKDHGLSVVKLKLLRAAKWKSALFQTRHKELSPLCKTFS